MKDYSVIILILAMAAYFLPAILAFVREHPHRWPILGCNLGFGATFIGWGAVLLWALASARRRGDAV